MLYPHSSLSSYPLHSYFSSFGLVSYQRSFVIVSFNEDSIFAKHKCTREYLISGKCVFNFLSLCLEQHMMACSLVWQTSSQSNIILFTICFVSIRAHSSLLLLIKWMKMLAPMEWNGMVKIRWKRTSENIRESNTTHTHTHPKWRNLETDHISCRILWITQNVPSVLYSGAKHTKKVHLLYWIRCTITRPSTIMPTTKLRSNRHLVFFF